MTVLKGEGKVPILFGSTSIAAGSVIHSGYLARPDLSGEWPTVVVLAPAWGVTSATKDICRRFARHGYAALAPDLFVGRAPHRSAPYESAAMVAAELPATRTAAIIEDIIEFIHNPAGYWSNAEQGFGVLGIGSGLGPAIVAASSPDVAGLALLSPVLVPVVYEDDGEEDVPEPVDPLVGLDGVAAQILAINGGTDDRAPSDRIDEARNAAPHAEWIVYEGLSGDFADDYAEGFDQPAFADAMERLTDFFEKVLPPA